MTIIMLDFIKQDILIKRQIESQLYLTVWRYVANGSFRKTQYEIEEEKQNTEIQKQSVDYMNIKNQN